MTGNPVKFKKKGNISCEGIPLLSACMVREYEKL
jgi:hypothetical protein